MSTTMRAKVVCGYVKRTEYGEELAFQPVAAKSYPADGSDEDNTFAKFSPWATFTIQCSNPALHGRFNPGEEYYVDFVPVPDAT